MPFTLLISLALLIIAAVWFFSHFYRRHMQGENAPQRSAEVTILDKQAIDIPHPLPGQDDQEFWIYVQKRTFRAKTRVSGWHSLLSCTQSGRQRRTNLPRTTLFALCLEALKSGS